MSRDVRRPSLASALSALRESPIGIFAFHRDGRLHSLARTRSLPAEEVDLRRDDPIVGRPAKEWRSALDAVASGGHVRTRLRLGGQVTELRMDPWEDERGERIGGVGLTIDVTGREEALQRLQARERRLQRITDHLGDVLAELDESGRIRFVTPSVWTLHQLSPEEVLGRSAIELVHPEDRDRVGRAFRRAVERREGYRIDARILRLDGTVRWTTSRTEFVRTAAGEARLLLFTRDVTELQEERRRLERRGALMRGASERSRSLLALSPEALGPGLERALAETAAELGADACVLQVLDPSTLELQRLAHARPGTPLPPLPGRRDVLPMRWLAERLAAGHAVHVASPEDWPQEAGPERARMARDGIRAALVLGVRADAGLVGTMQLLSFGDAPGWTEEDVPPLRILAEMLVGVFRRKLVLDAAERGRRLEAEVAQLSRRFLRLHGAETEGAFPDALELALRIARAELAILRFPRGDGGVETTRYAPRDGRPPAAPDPTHLPWVEAQLAAGRRVAFSDLRPLPEEARHDVRTLRELGVGSYLAIPLRPAEGPGGSLAVLTGDPERLWSTEEVNLVELVAELLVRVLDRDAAERRLQERQHALRQSQKMDAVGRLAGGIAHEFNNLLMVISGHAESLRDLPDAGEASADLREIEAATDRAVVLTRQLITLSGPESGRRQPLAVDALVREGERVWRRTLGEQCVLELDLGAEDGATLGERSDLEQILLNLLVNARDAMPAGGRVTVATRLLEGGDPHGTDAVELRVEDEGPGVAEEDLPHIFEPFYSTKGPGRGTGLGLSIVRHAVERLGGEIDVGTGAAGGARFRVRLPRSRRPPPAPSAETARTLPRGSGRILLAEDEDGVRRLMRRILQGAGYEVVEARDGAEALERILAEPSRFDAVVSDVVMPRIGGGGLFQGLRERGLAIPVLFVSGYPQDQDGAPGAPDSERLLLKPFTREAFLTALAEVLGG